MTTYDEKFTEVMSRTVPGQDELKMLDLYLIGEHLLNTVGMCQVLGHANPANSVLDYTPEPTETDHISRHIVRDLLAWQSGRRASSPGCEDRLRSWMSLYWLPRQLETMGDDIAGPAIEAAATA